MKKIFVFIALPALFILISTTASAQGDVRSATGMPIPIGQPVIWGQIELRGLRPGEPRPQVIVTLLVNGADMGRSVANDDGYYYFLSRPTDGSTLMVSVGGVEIGRQPVYSSRGERYDMAVNWTQGIGQDKAPGVISVRDAYTGRSQANQNLFDKASAAAKTGNANEAIKLYNEIVTNDPNDFVVWTELGTLYFTTKKNNDAEKAYKTALELKPDFAVALLNLGKLHLSQNKLEPAIESLAKAVEAEPNSPETNHFLGEAYLQARRGSLAVGYLNKAIELAPIEKAEIHLRLAALYHGANLKDRAVEEYKAFIAKVPDHPERKQFEKYIKDNSK
jgi:tetratricopeptide (TPR) repeat protein